MNIDILHSQGVIQRKNVKMFRDPPPPVKVRACTVLYSYLWLGKYGLDI